MADDLGKAKTAKLTHEAASWLVALDAGTADQTAFEAWRARDPRHAVAFAEVARAWGQLDRLRSLRPALGTSVRSVNRRALLRGAAAALAAGVVGIVAWPTLDVASAATGPGERRAVRLPEGILIELNTRTRIEWRRLGYDGQVRLDQGEIGVTVPVGRTLSFAGTEQVRLEAGVFNARLVNGRLTVLSLQGAVTVAGQRMPAGVVATSAGTAVTVWRGSAVELDRARAWRRGEIVFAGETLAFVLSEYNRYLDRPLVLEAGGPGDIRLGGRFASTDPRPFLDALEAGFGLSARDDGAGPITIERAKKDARR